MIPRLSEKEKRKLHYITHTGVPTAVFGPIITSRREFEPAAFSPADSKVIVCISKGHVIIQLLILL
jgi:hypothetical protein